MTNDIFQELIWQKGHELYRKMPWRDDTRPYYVLVSELMLQQTQVSRVIPKFEAFIEAFPNEAVLARASLADVLRLWQGLGYNRRAKYLLQAAGKIAGEYGGHFPADLTSLLSLPGVGKNTAGAIAAYAFNQPSVFVETNVRTVYIHHFFADSDAVHDDQLVEKLRQTIDREHPREWYWALMDYGAWLKAQGVRTNTMSTHYVKQSPLKGSVREVRGQIIRALQDGPMIEAELRRAVVVDQRFEVALAGLTKDGLVSQGKQVIHLTK